MFRIERAAALAVALTGCMRIYPDPDLPFVEVSWFAETDCAMGGDHVVISLVADDPVVQVAPVVAPCVDGVVRLPDVPRERYMASAKLEDAAGTELVSYDQEVDLRDGNSERVYAYFGRGFETSIQASWVFDTEASCGSLGANQVVFGFSMAGEPPVFLASGPCELGLLLQPITLFGSWVVSARAFGERGVVAISGDAGPFTFAAGQLTDLGSFTLTPCGDACPQIGE